MAQTVHLFLEIDGSKVSGDSTQEADGRKDSIECMYFESGAIAPRDGASGRAIGQRQFKPIKIRKRIDQSSPLLQRALTDSQCLKGTFLFFRPAANGSAPDVQFYTVKIGEPTGKGPMGGKPNGYISEIQVVMPDTQQDHALELRECFEEVSFVFDNISWEVCGGKDNGTKAMHSHSWSGGSGQ